jgi:hypothetical protein
VGGAGGGVAGDGDGGGRELRAELVLAHVHCLVFIVVRWLLIKRAIRRSSTARARALIAGPSGSVHFLEFVRSQGLQRALTTFI